MSKVPGIEGLLEACGGEIRWRFLDGEERLLDDRHGNLLHQWSKAGKDWYGYPGMVRIPLIDGLLAAYHVKYVTPLEGERDRLRKLLNEAGYALFEAAQMLARSGQSEFSAAAGQVAHKIRSALTEGEAVS